MRIIGLLLAFFIAGFAIKLLRAYWDGPVVNENIQRQARIVAFEHGAEAFSAPKKSKTGDATAIKKVNINQARADELETLPGVGPVLAKKIIDYRAENGYFQTIEALRQVKGIGPKLLERWTGLIKLDPVDKRTKEREK